MSPALTVRGGRLKSLFAAGGALGGGQVHIRIEGGSMLKHPKFVSRFGRARGIQRGAVSLLAVGSFIGAATLASVAASSAPAAAAAQPADAGAPCTFTLGSQSSSGTTAAPAILTGVGNGNSVSVTCTGLNPADSYGIFETSPLAVVTQPFSLSVLGAKRTSSGDLTPLRANGRHLHQPSHRRHLGRGRVLCWWDLRARSELRPGPQRRVPAQPGGDQRRT